MSLDVAQQYRKMHIGKYIQTSNEKPKHMKMPKKRELNENIANEEQRKKIYPNHTSREPREYMSTSLNQ